MSLLVIVKILALFVNMLTGDHKYSLCNRENLQQFIQMHLSKKQKVISDFVLYYWNLHETLNILEKKMTLIAYVFPKLRTAKGVVR